MRNREDNGPLSQLYGNNKNNGNNNFNPNNLVNNNNNNYVDNNNQGKFFSYNDIRNISINNPNNNQYNNQMPMNDYGNQQYNNQMNNYGNNQYNSQMNNYGNNQYQQNNNMPGQYYSENVNAAINNIYNRDYVRKEEAKTNINYNINDDYDFINTYVGVNQQKLLFNTKNFSALIFGEYYLFYRKLYLGGAILFFLKLLICLYLHWSLSILVNLIPFFLFNKYYVFIITNQIKYLKKKHPESRIELYNAVEKAGGVNYISVLIGIGINAGIALTFFIISLIFGFSSIFSNFWHIGPKRIKAEPDTYDGTLQYNQKINIGSKLDITIPKELTNTSNKYSYRGEITIGKKTVFNKCEFSVQVVDNYKNLDNLSELMSDYYDTEYSKRTINGTKWNHIEKDNRGSEDFFITKKGGNIYVYHFRIGMDADYELCKKYNEKLVSSLRFK